MGAIGEIRVPPVVRPGETFEVQVLASNLAPLNDFDAVEIDINGQCGPHQFLQFPATGRQSIVAVARDADGRVIDQMQTDVKVQGPSVVFDSEQGVAIATLRAIPNLEVPYKFTFKIGTQLSETHRDFAPAAPMSVDRLYTWQLGDDAERIITRVPWLEHDFLWDVDHSRRWSTRAITCWITPENIVAKRTLTITSAPKLLLERGFVVPMVRNDVNVQVGDGMFTCIVYIHNVGSETIALEARSVTPLGLGGGDEDGQDAPREFVALGEKLAFDPGRVGVVIVALRGGVDVPWRANGVTIRFAGTSNTGLPVRIAATFDLPIRPRELPHLVDVGDPAGWPWGEISDGLNRTSHGEGPLLGQWTVDTSTGTVASSLTPTPNGLAQLTTLADVAAQAVRLPFEDKGLGAGVPGASLVLAAAKHGDPPGTMHTLEGDPCLPFMPPVGPVAEHEVCDPDNIGDVDQAAADAGQLTCALSQNWVCTTRPGRWVNARKGDVILSPSDRWSLVADVLAAVQPSQPYSHSGMMTRNYDEITHSTASEDWLLDHKSNSFTADGSDGLQPEALHYLWPGIVAQSIQASIEGEPWVAPDNGKTYQISSFAPASGTATGFGYVPAMVVKPDPVLEAADPTIRASLHKVADGLRASSGSAGGNGMPARNSKSHYRFFCFTDARISETEIVAGGHGWASGTFPSVCSVAIWREMRKQSLQMEGPSPVTQPSDLELTDTLAGAMVAPGTLDGLYHYTGAERQAAGRTLFDKIHAEAYEQAGWLGEALTDASDDTANQIVNAFANDDVNGKDSDAWQSTGDSDGVSPANILFWDGPDRGGVFGFAEPAAYLPPKPERFRLSEWRKFAANGEIRGVVKRPDGTPVAHATIQVVESRIGGSDAAGKYQISNVPYVVPEGSEYSLTAAVVIDRELYTAAQTVLVNGSVITADIVLDAPPTSHRRLKVVASVVGGDDEDFPESDESYSHTNAPEEVELSKDAPFKVFGTGRDPIFRWGGEVRVEHYVEFALLPGAAVAVAVKGWLYEGTSESTNDLDGQGGTVRMVIGPNTTDTVKLHMQNTAEDEPDTFSNLTLTVTNDPYV